MIEIRPMINTLPKALKYMARYPGAAFLKYGDGARSSHVLSGGNRKRPVVVSLIHFHTGGISRNYTHRIKDRNPRQLIIRDGHYRTRYAVTSTEYEYILEDMEKFAQENNLSLIDRSNHSRG